VTITRRLMKPGQFDLQLKPSAPKSLIQAIDKFDHIIVTRNRLLPIEGYSDVNIRAQALFSGVIEEMSRTSNKLAGFGLEYWLGTPDGRGDLLDVAVSRTAGTLSQWVGDLRPSSLSAGTVNNAGTSAVTNNYFGITRREALDAVCRAAGAEWRVNPDWTLDAGTAANLFVTSPSLVITRRTQGDDGGYRGVEVAELNTSESVATYITEALVVGEGLVTATAAGSTSYVDGLNNALVMQAFVSAAADQAASAVAAAVVAERNAVRRELTLSSRSYNVTRFVDPGDWVYVWDEQADLRDQAVQVMFNGELISPIALRVHSVRFPLEEGMGVYVRRSGATPVYTDVSDWVEWETSPVRWEVGAANLPSSQSAAGVARLGANPEILQRLSTPAGHVARGGGFTPQTGITSATDLTDCTVSFNAPGGRIYEISAQVRVTQQTSAAVPELELVNPGGTVMDRWSASLAAGETDMAQIVAATDIPAAGTVSYKLRLKTGLGSVDTLASSTQPSRILITDIGPA
jgi:hypothetical protein